MGLLANYMMVDSDTLNEMMNSNNEELMKKLEESDNEVYDMDKLWDGLHFLLTGVSAGVPIEGNQLSEAVVGVSAFIEDDEDADFIAYSKIDELPDIISALEKVEFEKLKSKFDPAEFQKANIYPNIWDDEEKDSLFEELKAEYNGLLEFYRVAVKKNRNVIVSIF